MESTSHLKSTKTQQSPPLCETDGTASPPRAQVAQRPPSSGEEKGKERERKKRDWEYVLKSGLAGGIAGCAAKTAIAPLDRVKILFQASNPEFAKYSGQWLGVFTAAKDIVRNPENGGIMALFQGHSATLMRIFPYAAIKYMAYDKLHAMLMPTKSSETSGRLFLAGSSSGVLSVFITYPLELIRVRLAFETKRKRQKGSLKRIIGTIYTEGSTEAPFSSDARKRAGRVASASKAAATGTAGAGAGAVTGAGGNGSTSAAANLSTSAVQARAIAAGATASSPIPISPTPTATAATTNALLTRFPLLKFYRGFTVTVMGMIPYAGTSFLVFGRTKRAMQDAFPPLSEEERREKGWRSQFFWPTKTTIDLSAGAIAGAISQTAAYPFEVIRRRQQVGGILRPGSMLGMGETALWIWRTSGWRGFYVGLSIGFLKVVPMTSISFAVWMAMKRQMGI